MPVPVYKNLPSTKKPYAQFKAMNERGDLTAVRDGGRVYWFTKKISDKDPEKDLMFVGVRSVQVKKQFNFEGDWDRRTAKVIERLQKDIDKGVADVQRGKIE